MKTLTASFVSALLLLTATAGAGDIPAMLTSKFIAGDVAFTATNNYSSRSGLVLHDSYREETFVAVNCKVTRMAITPESITCEVLGRWSLSSPGVYGVSNVICIHKGGDEERWKALCEKFRAWNETNTLSIRCKSWADSGDCLIFSDSDNVQIGPEKEEIAAKILHQYTPTLAISGNAGWRTH